jgi:hypothetical protein
MVAMVLVVAGGCGPLAAPSPADLTEADLAGVWQNDDGKQITFAVDRTFSADEIPYEILPETPPAGAEPPPTGSGTWELVERNDTNSVVTLAINRLAGQAVNLTVEMNALVDFWSAEPMLVFYVGDPDAGDWVAYEKCTDC